MKTTIAFEHFDSVDIRTGRVVEVRPFERARTPTYKLWIDFGDEIGIRTSSAQARSAYDEASLRGRLVLAVVNLPPKNIAGFLSEALVLGVPSTDGTLSLVVPDREACLGGAVY